MPADQSGPGRSTADNLPPLREIIAAHGLSARRALGQHFLLDSNLTDRIARAAAPSAKTNVIEVGPGPGGLTRALLATPAAHVTAIERDQRCLDALSGLVVAYPDRLTLVPADAMEVDPASLCPAPRQIIANLPYNIATALLLRWSHAPTAFERLTLMFQKEVAARLLAEPRSKAYGRLSVIVQWLFEVTTLFDISPRAFTPPPKVTSTLVQLTPRPEPAYAADRATLERVTAAAFGGRRKMLRSSLKTLGPAAADMLTATGIAPEARAETLGVAEFCTLARAYAELTATATSP